MKSSFTAPLPPAPVRYKGLLARSLLAVLACTAAAGGAQAHEPAPAPSPAPSPTPVPAAGPASPGLLVTVCKPDPFTGRERTSHVLPFLVDPVIQAGGYRGPCAVYGDVASLGNGQGRTFVQFNPDGSPHAMGLEMAESVLSNLPEPEADGNTCWDTNNDGVWGHGECAGGHQRILFFPKVKNTPIHWFLWNWMSHGHLPWGIYSVAHFDMHFYTQDYLERNRVRPGPCGIVVNCDDFAKATKPVPSKYMPPDYQNVGAVAGREGNHLLDLSSPEFGPLGSRAFTHTFIYGAYDGKLTFWEPMISLSYLQTKPSQCTRIKLPASYEVAGYYPTEYCIRYRPSRKDYAITLERFQYRQAG